MDSLAIGIQYQEPKLLYHNNGNGTFKDVSQESGPGITTAASGRGLAIGDLWNDGQLSVVVANRNAAPSLLANRRKYSNHWIAIRTVGMRSNRDGIGAGLIVRTAARTLVDEVRSGSSYVSNSDMRVHFGLGAISRVEYLEVRWPSGLTERFASLPIDTISTIREGSGRPVEPAHPLPAK